MNARQKKVAIGAAGVLGLILLAMRRAPGKGTVTLGPVTVTNYKLLLDKATNDAIQRLSLGLARSRLLMGADPNTLVSRQPSASEIAYIEDTLSLGKQLATQTNGTVAYPVAFDGMLALSRKLPGDTLQQSNAALYGLLGIDPTGNNEPTVPLTPAIEAAARAYIAKWRPYSQDAVDTLYAQLDAARELGGGATA